MSLTLWLIRHGQSAMNAGQWTDKPNEARLTSLGQEQAQKAAMEIELAPDLIIISPLLRAQESAAFVLARWPQSPSVSWLINEFVYLSPQKLKELSDIERKQLIQDYWEACDPFYSDGDDTESFHAFLKRVEDFHNQLSHKQGFVVVVGHGQFFKAYQLGLQYGFHANADWMKRYRNEEVKNPIKNSEILKMFFE